MRFVEAIVSIGNFGQRSRWQGASLSRLASVLAFSLATHIGLGLWLSQPVQRLATIRITASQQLEIRLVGKHPAGPTTKFVPPRQNARTVTEPSTSIAGVETAHEITEPIAPDVAYFAPEDVENMADVVDINELPLPENAKTPGGALCLKVLINESGSADKIDIMASTLPHEYAETLIDSFYRAKFSPALIAGLPVRSWRIIEIRFDSPEPVAG